MSLKKFTLSLATVASLSLLVACSSTTKSTPSSQASTSSEASTSQVSETSTSSSTTSTKTDTTTNLDGTYKGQDEGDSITLVVTGNTGTWTEVEANGDKEVKKVTFEPENQKVIIGDDVKSVYTALGGRPDVAVNFHPVTEAGRIEMLPFLREQAVSITAHRFGNPNPFSESVISSR